MWTVDLQTQTEGQGRMFTVKKKGNRPGNTQRLIVDCRQANYLQRRPATTRLATPAGLAALDFDWETLSAAGFGGIRGEPNLQTRVGDWRCRWLFLQLCHQRSMFLVQHWWHPEHVRDETTRDLQDTIYDDDAGVETPVERVRLFLSASAACQLDGRGLYTLLRK